MLNPISSLDFNLDRLSPPTAAPSVRAAAPTQAAASTAAQPVDFMDVLAEVSGSAMADLRAGEAASIAGMEGKMSVQQVVEAVMSAEKSLQTALAVRDKVVSAYQEIGRMAI
ncbi:flagellar hook-basal body protein FliE [Pleomorphomonas diazotrophica]|uniref:Flagellar hook-basal body complex protein FliE n=1 Tax=Pleomorphomonas diazotrophica TaxID=1166257 RepID=A0A1I4QGH9_9HYPH|nr:flagellar hook-basal body complex protein FliE [Pleomorphomonas diazotrophica]PKR90693.1 flagellar hook-basal body protein FliE [Pleomorphomonas diazotrophica]SFM38876.1 flagellar hook-basal body complex protein FliE [Pleomorphomonas diazotrophica]